MASPPGPGRRHRRRSLLAAARIAGVDTVYRMGGAQAIAALAYGTDSVARVDKILGPGNIFVALAKQQVYGTVAIDGLRRPDRMPAGRRRDGQPDVPGGRPDRAGRARPAGPAAPALHVRARSSSGRSPRPSG